MKKQEKVEKELEKKERSVVGTVAGYFTIQWLVQTIAAWGFSMWLTKLWKKYMKKKEKKDASNN